MKLIERPLDQLKIHQMRPDELRKHLLAKKKLVKSFKELTNSVIEQIEAVKHEIRYRPKTKAYKPGLYWGNTAYGSGDRWVEGNEELVIVDADGCPWMFGSAGWWKFGEIMNRTSQRMWIRIGDI